MVKLLVIITCVVVLTTQWGTFKDKINLPKILEVTKIIIHKVKE